MLKNNVLISVFSSALIAAAASPAIADPLPQLPSLAIQGTAQDQTAPQTVLTGTMLVHVQGTVLLDRGQGFQPVAADTAVAPGDRVRAVNGSVEILYPNGTEVEVTSGQTLLVVSSEPVPDAPPTSGISTELLAGGFALGGAGAALLALEAKSSKSQPASP